MQFLNTKNDRVPTINETISTMYRQNSHLGIPLDYDRLLQYHAYYMTVAGEFRAFLSNLLFGSVHKQADVKVSIFKKWAKDEHYDQYFLKTEQGGVSMSGDSIEFALASGRFNQEDTIMLRAVANWQENLKVISLLRGIIENHKPLAIPSNHGSRMIFVYPSWYGQNTGRFAMRDPAIQNISRITKDVMCAPVGYELFDADSGQIDPTITFSTRMNDPQIRHCISLYKDAYFGLYHYCSLPVDVWRSKSLDITANEINEEMKSGRQELKKLVNRFIYGSKDVDRANSIQVAFEQRVGNHPMHQKWVKELEDKAIAGDYFVTCQFGTKVDMRNEESDKSKSYDKTSKAYIARLVRSGLSGEIQGTAAELMRFAVDKSEKIIISSMPNSCITCSIHDNLYYLIANSERHIAEKELAGLTAYQVDDWLPIYSAPEWGVVQTDPNLPLLYVLEGRPEA